MRSKSIAAFAAIMLCFTGVAYSQIDKLAEKPEAAKQKEKTTNKDVTFSLHGFVQANFVASRNDIGVSGNKWRDSRYEFPRVGGTVRLELEGNAYDIAHFFAAVETEYNAAGEKKNFLKFYDPGTLFQYTYLTRNADFDRSEFTKNPSINVREAYVDLYSRHVTFRAGQQLIAWGEIEGIEAPSDIIAPWDYTTMSNYFEYSRIGVTAANLSFYFANQQLQFIWIPIFQPTKLPLDSVYHRGVTSISRPEFEARNSEYAARLSGVIGNNFRYGLAFKYGYDQTPDTRVVLPGAYQTLTFNGISLPVYVPNFVFNLAAAQPIVFTELYYNRVYEPALDLGIGVKDVLAWKVSANASFTQDFWGRRDLIKNPTVTYLTGPESTNMFAKFYVGIYIGQQWVINYTKPADEGNPIQLFTRIDAMKLPNKEIFKGYGQLYPYTWMLSSNIQRSFLPGDALDFQVRFALYTDPKLKKWDYVVYPYLMYKFTGGVSSALGLIIANRRGDDRWMIISETRYSF
jgi:hypothetical protein